MGHWSHLATRNWLAKPGRALAVTISVALGVATVVAITSFYESVSLAISERVVGNWLGKAHLSIEHFMGHWGTVDQNFASDLRTLDGVADVTSRSKRQINLLKKNSGTGDNTGARTEIVPVDAVGIQPDSEYAFRTFLKLQGRLIQPGESGVTVVEADAAKEWNIALGDSITLAITAGTQERAFTVVGMYSTRRLAQFQRPTVIISLAELQELKSEPGIVTQIDVMLRDPTEIKIADAANAVETIVRERGLSYQVTSAQAKLQQLHQAEETSHLILMLVAVVTMLTSFFIILTTMGMGIVERIGQLGVMRCVGVTRWQLTVLIGLEVMPLGLAGVLLGIPLGIGLTYAGAAYVPDYIQGVTISAWGIKVAATGGILTTLVVATALAIRTGALSPLAAATPHQRAVPWTLTVVSVAAGLALIVLHETMLNQLPPEWWIRPPLAFFGLATIYGGYALIAPGLVASCGIVFARITGTLLGIRGKLAQDQLHKSTWRGSGVCWMLMVGLSLIVYIAVRSESIIAAWDFPGQLPETFVWSPDPVSLSLKSRIAELPGVKAVTVIREFDVEVVPMTKTADQEDEGSFLDRVRGAFRKSVVRSTFVAGEPDAFLNMAHLGYLEGNSKDARAKIESGGHVLLPPQAAKAYGLGLGDTIRLRYGARSADFEVAGVAQSPAMDIAVSYFEAESYMMIAAAGAILGTVQDAQEKFGVNDVTMYMMNIVLSNQSAPEEFFDEVAPTIVDRWMASALVRWNKALAPEAPYLAAVVPALDAWSKEDRNQGSSAREDSLSAAARDELSIFVQALRDISVQWDALEPQKRWEAFREQAVLRRVADIMERPSPVIGSIRRLKESILGDIRQAVLLLSIIPAVALFVAALGVANLMIVSVASRGREIAVLRAIGTTKAQIVRLVMAEALSLGCVGCVVGVLLGLHSARSMNTLTERMTDIVPLFTIPWAPVLAGIGLTGLVCVLAGIAPARHAARNNIVDAMQTT